MATKQQAMLFASSAIRPALLGIKLWSPAAEQLLLGTALVESDLRYRRQLGSGPARGLFQMEPATHDDIWANFLKYKPTLAQDLARLMTATNAKKLTELERNDKYASAMARVHYLRMTTPLPRLGDVQAMAGYWKRYYNTLHGAGTVSTYITKWHQTMGGSK